MGKQRSDYPYWAYSTLRAFKQKKRRDVARLAKALDELRQGSAYTPISRSVDEMDALVKAALKAMSVKEWGR